MEFIEKYFIIFAAILIVAGIALVTLCLKRDFVLHKRKAISYENYKEYKGYFVFEPNKILMILGVLYLATLTVMCFLILRNNVLRIYLIVFITMEIFVGASLILYYLSKKYNKNIDEFDTMYESINNSYINKQKLLDIIDSLKLKRDEIRNEVKNINDNCENLILNYRGIKELSDIDKPLSDIIETQESLANGFDNTMTGIFTRTLLDYLKSGRIVSHTYNIFNPMIGVEIEKVCAEIQEEKKRIFSAFIVSAFEKAQFKNNKALIRLLDILIKNNMYKDNEYTTIVLNYLSTNEKNRDEVVNCLYNNNLIRYQSLLLCEEKEYDFVFDRSLNRFVLEKELIEFVSIIIKKNKYKLANKYLVFCTKSDCEIIKTAIDIAGVSNKTAELFEGYYYLLQLDSGYNDVSTRYESIALTLRSFYSKDQTSLDKINNIIQQESFLHNRVSLDAMYNKALTDIQPVLDKCFKSLLYYFVYGRDCVNQVVEEKVKWLFIEYKKTLNVRGLLCLAAVLDGLMLINVREREKAKSICDNILTYGNLCKDFDYYPLSANSKSNYVLYGKEIIENLYKDDNIYVLRNVIIHIEKNRLTLDVFRKL